MNLSASKPETSKSKNDFIVLMLFGLNIALAALAGYFFANSINVDSLKPLIAIGFLYNICFFPVALIVLVLSLLPFIKWKYKRIVTHVSLFYIVFFCVAGFNLVFTFVRFFKNL